MGEFTQAELLILENCVKQIESQVLTGIEDNAEKDRMFYASCLNDEEKIRLTKKEIKKQQKKLVKCPADIAGYMTAYINPNSFDIQDDNLDQYRERIIRNYVASTFVEVCESLLNHKFKTIQEIEAEDESFWEVLIDDKFYGVDDDSIRAFIKYIIIADKIKTYKTILKAIENENSQHILHNTINEELVKSNDRMKTNISVPQLALLFKMINDLKPKIFQVDSEAELHRFISANFQTKNSDPDKGISENKLRILFNQPDTKAIEFWEKHLRTMLAEIKKSK